jgi:hypothetical protein
MNHVVQLGTFSDCRDAQRRAVDATICANLNAIGNLHPANLRKFFVRTVREDEPEAVRSDHRTGMHNYVVADGNLAIDGYPWMQYAIFTDLDTLVYDTPGTDGRTPADADAASYAGQRSYGNILS